MKIFNKNAKINFVDKNNVFVGYDARQSCCELAGWYIKVEITPYTYDLDYDEHTFYLEDYSFDQNFFLDNIDSNDLDAGGMVVFKLICCNKPDLYLHLFNNHNGYYGHGFKVKHGGETVNSGVL